VTAACAVGVGALAHLLGGFEAATATGRLPRRHWPGVRHLYEPRARGLAAGRPARVAGYPTHVRQTVVRSALLARAAAAAHERTTRLAGRLVPVVRRRLPRRTNTSVPASQPAHRGNRRTTGTREQRRGNTRAAPGLAPAGTYGPGACVQQCHVRTAAIINNLHLNKA